MKKHLYFPFTVCCILFTAMLGGCGATGSVSPQQRVEQFITSTVAAFNDRNLNNETRQEELATQLASYFVPESQATQKVAIKDSLARMAQTGAIVKLEQLNLTTLNQTGTTANVQLNTGWLDLNVGQSNTQIDLKQSGIVSSGDTAKLRKIAGIWYIEP